MRKMILWTIVLFAPLLWTTSVHAIFGIPDVAALAQRVTIIANQGIQIAHSVTQISKITEQFNQLKDQYDHLRQQALGEIGALTQPFTDLSAIPGQLVSEGLDWRGDFTGTDTADLIDALEQFSRTGTPLTDYWRDQINNAPDVTEQEVLAEYDQLPVSLAERAAANYRRHRAQAEQRTALNHNVNTAAATAAATVASALTSYNTLREQTNKSDTALREAQVTGLITSGEVMTAQLQLHAHQVTKAAAEELAAETRRREREAARLATLQAARADHDRRLAGIASRADGGAGLRLRVR